MANIVKPKRSNTAGNPPTTINLASGELGVNMADQKTYINNGTAVVQIGAGNLSGLGDVVVTSPANTQTLVYNSATSKWVNGAGGGGGNLTGAVTSVGNATSLGSFTSSDLAAALTNETGTGSAVFATSPTLVTPALGAATATSLVASGVVTGSVLTATNGFFVNSLSVISSYSIPAGSSAMSVGPITIGAGAAITVPSGSRWVIL